MEKGFKSLTKRIAVLISGGGTNLQALIDSIDSGDLDAQIVLVASNRKAAYGLERARSAGIETLYFPLKAYREQGKTREDYDHDLAEHIAAHSPDLLVLAGWMHIVSPAFLAHFSGRVINLHPALPGQFPGIDAIERAYEAFQRGEITTTGCMVHYVVPEVDAGPVIATANVPIHADDTLADVEARMHSAEHTLIIQATGLALNDIDQSRRVGRL